MTKKTKRGVVHPTAGQPYVCRPIPDFVKRLEFHDSARFADNEMELSWIDPDTGMVVYTTVNRKLDGTPSRGAALNRALNWARRHGFHHDPVDHGYFTRRAI